MECSLLAIWDTILSSLRWTPKLLSTANEFLRLLFQEIWSALEAADWNAQVVHVYREANCGADFLANLGHEGSFNCVMLNAAPAALNLILFEDRLGTGLPRMVH